jgi:hypothetical protein
LTGLDQASNSIPILSLTNNRFLKIEAAQRFALLALGQAWILFGSRENSKPENYRKMPQNPQRPVHALLGGVFGNSLLICLYLMKFF